MGLLYVDRNFSRHPIKTSYSFIGDECIYIVLLGHSFKNVIGKMSEFYIDFDYQNMFFIDKEMNTSFDAKHYLKIIVSWMLDFFQPLNVTPIYIQIVMKSTTSPYKILCKITEHI